MDFVATDCSSAHPDVDGSSDNTSFSGRFWITFNEQQAVIVKLLDDSNVSPETVSRSKALITELQNFVTAAAIDLPKYDLRRSQEEIDKLKKTTSSIEATVQPKKKFSFSSRNKDSKKVPAAAASDRNGVPPVVSEKMQPQLEVIPEGEGAPAASSQSKSFSAAFAGKSICIEDRSGEACIDITAEVEKDIGYQVYVKNCTNCTISVRTTIGSARLENLKGCQVLLGPCCTSTYVENCEDCTFFIRCHQLRIHHARGCSFYVLVNSHPIIEDCSALGFGPYCATYPQLLRDVEVANLASASNWANVVDFRWHRSTASPNWFVIPQQQRVGVLEASGWAIEGPPSSSSGDCNAMCDGNNTSNNEEEEEEM